MSLLPKSVSKVVEAFERLPGIGPKTAQRLAFYLLHVPQTELTRFATAVSELKVNTLFCAICKNVADSDPCSICADPRRDQTVICVVEQPSDVLSLERTGKFVGVYHVLHGAIDPLNNIGPDEIYVADLVKRVKSSVSAVREIILATNPNMEGEATAMYLQKELTRFESSNSLVITRLAHGLPVGADIEYADAVTLARSLDGRRKY